MAQWTRKSAIVRREEIVTAAVDLIGEQGLSKVSLQRVAERAGLSKALIYVHFDSKQALFREVTRRSLEAPMNRAQSALKKAGPIEERAVEMLLCKLGRFYEAMADNVHGTEIIDSVNRVATDLIDADRKAYVGLFKRLFEEGVDAGEIELSGNGTTTRELAEVVVAATHGLARNGETIVSQRVLARRCRLLIRTLLAGLQPA